jgi:hypothetical protein
VVALSIKAASSLEMVAQAGHHETGVLEPRLKVLEFHISGLQTHPICQKKEKKKAW